MSVSGTDREACIVTYDRKPEEPQHKTHVAWATSNSTIRNLTLVGRDVKYCIHSDGGRDYVLTVENCVLRREAPAGLKGLQAAFGIGLRGNQHIVVRNCRFEAETSVFIHNWDRQKAGCSLTIENSVLGGAEEAMIVHTLGSGQRDVLVLHDNILHGSKSAIRYVNTEKKEPRPRKGADEIEIFASGNELRAPLFGAVARDDAGQKWSGIDRANREENRFQAASSASGRSRAILRLPTSAAQEGAPRVTKMPVDFREWLKSAGLSGPFDQYALQITALDGKKAGQPIPFRLDHQWNLKTKSYREAGGLSLAVRDASVTQIAVQFGAGDRSGEPAAIMIPVIGDGDFLRLAGDGRTTFSAAAIYPSFVDFDGDGRRDLVGSDRYGTDARVVWFRNIGTDTTPAFSVREVYPLQTDDGKDISNPNRGWMLTTAVCDWDGDGSSDLVVGGWCRYLTFHRNIGSAKQPVYAQGRRILDARIFPGRDYGSNEDTIYQGVFIEPCDWDGDGDLDLLCGSYLRGRIFVLRNDGRDAQGLPILAAPVALSAGGREIDFLAHGKPSVGDWDGDGDLDLMSGQYYQEAAPARVTGAYGCYYFENTGTRTRPELAAGTRLRASDGQLIWMGFHSAVMMVDWNRDGRLDVFACGTKGSALFLNLDRAGQPSLVRTDVPLAGQAACRVSHFAYPIAHDLDRDGKRDLVVGDADGYVHFFRGVGGVEFAPAVKLQSAGQVIDEVGCPDGGEADLGFVKVAIADWNRDGHDDLIMWSNNGLDGWQRGSMGPDNWCLKFFPGTADPLNFGVPSEIKAGGQHIMAGYRSKPDVVDLDGDGLLDMIVSCGNGKVNGPGTLIFFRNLSADVSSASAQTGSAPQLAAGVPLQLVDGQRIDVAVRTAVRFADWDGDGDLDLFTGNHSPTGLRYWENKGTKSKALFAAGSSVKLVNDIVKSHHEIGVDVVALDGGARPDLIIGNGDSGMVHFFRRSFLDRSETAQLVRIEPSEK